MRAPLPVDEEQALRKQPCAVRLCERVEVTERGDHQAALSTIDRDVVRQAVGFAGGLVARQREDGALSDEVRSGVVPVQLGENRSERLACVEPLRWLRVLGVHVHHKVCVRGKKRHLAFRIATIGAMGVGLDELPDRQTIRGFAGRDRQMLAHMRASFKTLG